MSLVKSLSILLIPLTALICELIFVFSSAAFMAQIFFKTAAPVFLRCNSTLFFSSKYIFKGQQFVECTTILTFYSILTSYNIYKANAYIQNHLSLLPPHVFLIQMFLSSRLISVIFVLFWWGKGAQGLQTRYLCVCQWILDSK